MATTVANVRMAEAWDGDEGADWARDWERYDRSVLGYHRLLLEAAGVGRSDRVLDVGCGNGQTTRDAALAGEAALGVDLSSLMIARARALAAAEGLANASFEQADAQVHPFEPARFDIALSRFGAMFFADAEAAFANIAAGLRPGGRLVITAWRGVGDNEWLRCVFAALAQGRDLPVPPAGAPGPFGLADADHVRTVLDAAGFDSVDLAAVDEPLWLGADGDDAYRFFGGTGIVRGMTKDVDAAQRAAGLDALRQTMVDHAGAGGVEFGSGAWLITGRRR
jgi:SAM-dependent methyltransferase